jgi:polyisoprenoid-binding protein YceI
MARIRYELDPDRSQVWIDGSSSIHPIRATATGLHGWVELQLTDDTIGANPNAAGEVRVEVDRLKSGNPLVDAETRRRIDAGHHPEIVGVVTASSHLAPDRLALTGDITFRGETRAVDGELVISVDGDDLRLAGSQQLDVRDWGLQPPRVGLLRVHPDITVRFEAVARPV